MALKETTWSLSNVWRAVTLFRYWVLASTGIVTVMSIAIALNVPAQWQATALVQIGQVGRADRLDQSAQNQSNTPLVETPGALISRVMHPSFLVGLKAYFSLHSIKLTENEVLLLKKTLKAVQTKNADLIEIRLRAYSPELAREYARSSIEYLRDVQNASYSVGVSRLRAQQASVVKNIQQARAQIEALDKRLYGKRGGDDLMLTGMLLKSKNNELQELEERELILEEMLDATRTFPTRIIGDVYVNENPVFPNVPLIAVIVLLLSLTTSILVASFIHFRRPSQDKAD